MKPMTIRSSFFGGGSLSRLLRLAVLRRRCYIKKWLDEFHLRTVSKDDQMKNAVVRKAAAPFQGI